MNFLRDPCILLFYVLVAISLTTYSLVQNIFVKHLFMNRHWIQEMKTRTSDNDLAQHGLNILSVINKQHDFNVANGVIC